MTAHLLPVTRPSGTLDEVGGAPPPARLLHPSATPGRLDGPTLLALANGLATTAADWPGLDHGPSDRRRWALMTASPFFEAWAIVWPPGGTVELHDHGGAAGALAVTQGVLSETALLCEQGRLGARTTVLTAGSSTSFDRGHIHDVVNPGTGPALSVHVYAPRLSTMAYYRFDTGRLVVERVHKCSADEGPE